MELKDVKLILKRIQTNYQNFIVDNYVQSEWYKELKDYSLEDVMEKLEQHFRSEQYGNMIPKVYFLTKYLKKESEKNKDLSSKIILKCSICKENIPFREYDKHYERCASIEYLEIQANKYFGKGSIDKEKYRLLTELDFNSLYDKVLKTVYEKTNDDEEKDRIMKYFESADSCGIN